MLRLSLLSALLLATLAPVGCAPTLDGTGYSDSDDLADMDSPGSALDQLGQELTEKYGVRPHRYFGFYNGDNLAELRFLAYLPALTTELATLARARNVDLALSEDAFAINFITEGGFLLLNDSITDTNWGAFDAWQPPEIFPEDIIDGYRYLGVDTFVNNIDALNPWIPSRLLDYLNEAIESERPIVLETPNELGQTVQTVVVDTIENGIGANACVFAWSRSIFARDLAAEGLDLTDIPPEAAFFWTTIYFNAGPGFGKETLKTYGVDYYQTKWTHDDDADRYGGNALYNALWRTASFEYLHRGLALVDDQ